MRHEWFYRIKGEGGRAVYSLVRKSIDRRDAERKRKQTGINFVIFSSDSRRAGKERREEGGRRSCKGGS